MAPHIAYFRVKISTHTRHISEFCLKIGETAGAYSLQICDYLSQIQRETKAFLLIVRHNTEGPPFSDWQWRHRTLFIFVGLKNRVNLYYYLNHELIYVKHYIRWSAGREHGCCSQNFFFRISMTSINPQTRCALLILLIIQQFLHLTLTLTMFMPQWTGNR